jgi:hypothetical protein
MYQPPYLAYPIILHLLDETIVFVFQHSLSVHISTCPTLCYCLLRTVDYHPLLYGYRHDADTPISLV